MKLIKVFGQWFNPEHIERVRTNELTDGSYVTFVNSISVIKYDESADVVATEINRQVRL